MKSITIRLEEDIHKRLKLKTVKEETSIQNFIEKLILESLEKEEK